MVLSFFIVSVFIFIVVSVFIFIDALRAAALFSALSVFGLSLASSAFEPSLAAPLPVADADPVPVGPVPSSLAAKPTLNAASTAAALLATLSRFAQVEIARRVGASSQPVT